MRYIPAEEHVKVPVFKNIIYALRLVWKTDRRLVLSHFMLCTVDDIFELYIQNILFLKVLLTIIEGGSFNDYIRNLIGFFAVAFVAKALVWFGVYHHMVGAKTVLKGINNLVFRKALSLDVGCYENPEFYDKYQRATLIMTKGYFDTLTYDVAQIVSGIVTFACVIGTVTVIDPKYLLFLLPVVFVFIIEFYKSKTVYKRDLKMTKNNRTKSYIQRTVFLKDYSKDMRTSNIFFVILKRFKAAIDANVEILRSYGIKLFLYSVVSSLFGEFIPIIGTYAYAGYQFVQQTTMTVSGFSVVLSSINSIRESTMMVAESFEELTQMALYFQYLRDFFDYEPKVVGGEKEAGEFESLEFRDVTFRYPSAEKNALEHISFKINKGDTIAVVGINGAGKSTLVKLMLRFYDPDEGEILYNGVNIKEYTLDSYRNAFATVFQDYKNFAISVFENVMCRECTDEDKALARKALEQSGAWDKISSFEKGGETVITREFDKEGAGLSGGESQKLSTARLFAKDFQLAILDEPSSALDPIAEYKMYENLVEATKEKTVIYISHRLSSAVLSDRIYVIGGGTILEQGTHEELMAADGEYAEMFSLQASRYLGEEVSEDE